MRALRRDPDRARVDPNAPEPAPGNAEALIRPLRTAIGSPDLAVASGRLPFAGVMGHRFVGVVERLHGSASRDEVNAWVGTRVVGSISLHCGTCERCRRGLSAHCASRRVLGLAGRDGCFADRFTLPLANLVPVPKAVVDDAAVFAEPLAAAVHIAQLLRIQGKPYVTVLGDGLSGLLAAQVLVRLNASVRVLGLSESKLALCDKWGIKHRHANDAGRRHDQDVVVDCSGSPAGLALAMQLVRPRGKIVLRTTPGPVPDPPLASPSGPSTGVDLAPAVVNEIELIGARCGRLSEATPLLAAGQVEVHSLITRRFAFADAESALKGAEQPDQVAVVLDH